MRANIELNTKQLEKALDELGKSQLKYATAKAINAVMVKAQAAQLEAMSAAFIIRRPAYAKRSVKITQFAKKNFPTGIIGIANIGAQESVFSKFEKGGIVTGRNGRKAIPSVWARPNKAKVIPAGKRPRNLKNSFLADDNRSLMVRVGRGKNERTELAYSLLASIRVRPVLKFEQRISKIVSEQWPAIMAEELAKAIATARLN